MKNVGRKTLGEIAWEEYVTAVGGFSFDDKPLPGWYDLGVRQREGWNQAAEAVVEEHQARTVMLVPADYEKGIV